MLVVSLLMGAVLAFLGYRICSVLYGKSHGLLAGLFLFTPYTWLLATLILTGYIRDRLYTHFGAVGLFGVTAEQIRKFELE